MNCILEQDWTIDWYIWNFFWIGWFSIHTWNEQSSTGASCENFCLDELFTVSYKRTVQSHELTNRYWLEFGANLHDEITSLGALFNWISFFLSILIELVRCFRLLLKCFALTATIKTILSSAAARCYYLFELFVWLKRFRLTIYFKIEIWQFAIWIAIHSVAAWWVQCSTHIHLQQHKIQWERFFYLNICHLLDGFSKRIGD